MIASRLELIERLKDVMAVEMRAREAYEQDLLTFKNFEIRETIASIKIDEDKHIQLLEELLRALGSSVTSPRAA